MQIKVHLDVFQNGQLATANVVQCGQYTSTIYPVPSSHRRYEAIFNIPHPTDSEAIVGTFEEITSNEPSEG